MEACFQEGCRSISGSFNHQKKTCTKTLPRYYQYLEALPNTQAHVIFIHFPQNSIGIECIFVHILSEVSFYELCFMMKSADEKQNFHSDHTGKVIVNKE